MFRAPDTGCLTAPAEAGTTHKPNGKRIPAVVADKTMKRFMTQPPGFRRRLPHSKSRHQNTSLERRQNHGLRRCWIAAVNTRLQLSVIDLTGEKPDAAPLAVFMDSTGCGTGTTWPPFPSSRQRK